MNHDLVLTTFNARYAHASLGLRYLYANLGALQPHAVLEELDLALQPVDVVERLLAHSPRIIGLGVYVWNAEQSLAVVELLKVLRPDIAVIVGGPEVSHEVEAQRICTLADVVVVGEGDAVIAPVCERLLRGGPVEHLVQGGLPKLTALSLPYRFYSDEDLAHRVVYVEASRGCPFTCSFCLSALDTGVRRFDEDALLAALDELYQRGLRQFKFVDRTFNLSITSCTRILQFFLARLDPDLFVHFELIPDRLPTALKPLIAAFPPGALQFELGVQTLDPEVAARIERRHDPETIEANLRWLRTETGVHLHTDLIVGLPGESAESFARGFDRLHALRPHEIQVGILKRLRGAPIAACTEAWAMRYSPRPPYEVLQTSVITFEEMCRLKRFARFWELLSNSGLYPSTLALLLGDGPVFDRFVSLSEFLSLRFGRSHALSASRVVEALFEFGGADAPVARALIEDLFVAGRLPLPEVLRPFATEAERQARKARPAARGGRARQDAHLAGAG